MTHEVHPTTISGAIELLSEHGFDGMAHAMQLLVNGRGKGDILLF